MTSAQDLGDVSGDDEDRSRPSIESRRHTLVLAAIGLAAAVLLFASAALPVLSDRAGNDASSVPSTSKARLPPATSSVPQLPSPSTLPQPSTTVDLATKPSTTTVVPSTSPPTPPSTTQKPPPEDVRAPTAVITRGPPRRDGVPGGRLTVGPIDTSAFPRIAFDVLVPEPLAAVRLRAAMVDFDGVPVDSVTPIDPRDVGAALVIDDGPAVDAEVLGQLQGASVELVRNLGRGSEIALATPSGLASAFTPSPDANIGRIAAITAGSPAVTPLPGVLTSAIHALGSNPTPDRHAVLVLGEALDPTAEQLDALERALTLSGTRLHVILPKGTEAPALASAAKMSGGVVASSATIVASIDEVTAAIARRYRVVATVASRGEHSIALAAKKLRYEVTVRL
jgi:hypothetical protein